MLDPFDDLPLFDLPPETAPVWRHPPRYLDRAEGAAAERWHASAVSCAQSGAWLVPAITPQGLTLTLAVSQRAWHLRLNADKSGYLAERAGGYPEHHCPAP
jgi:hypothetical protein